MKKRINLALFCSVCVLFTSSLFADQWLLPQEQSYISQNAMYRFTVMPRTLESAGKYWAEKRTNQKPGQLQGGLDACWGVLEKKIDGGYQLIWKQELDNNVAPVSVLISNSGQYVVTFDNWHEVGYGDNVIVIYNEKGQLKKKYPLEDIMSANESGRIWQSTSSRNWGYNHYIDSEKEQLVLRLYIFHDERARSLTAQQLDEQATIRRIDLKTGNIINTSVAEK